ncbi:MAG TPA: PVC-type heme-binding CxxCH protein [Lacipirellulaceae bacterium]|nr:PVC-type heme-binding CxxCH protein [Lacipirellulaceae bacterium]
MKIRSAVLSVTLIALSAFEPASAKEPASTSPPLPNVPPGFSIELAAGPPLVERPIVASFDDQGRLYVAESSGSNDPVQVQLEKKPHRIVRLEDANGDGKFDKRTVFADHMMFPEGALFFDGSLYVSAPPSIWKLTDKDGDGVADERVEWFKGGTLTGCANDLHGPYAGPDGYIYWCKGAFAEQTHIVNGKEWKSKAAHIFRCRPDGTGLEPVMTGGMDNPVEVVFTPGGEMILSGTFFHVNPRQDGLIHVIYGGVYGKEHGVLDGHPRTGELMPILDPLGAVAACGLARYDSEVFGPEYRDNLFLCQFNMRKVSRHILKPAGATYKTEDSDFVWSDFVDFHPTDVVVDADGSLLVIDTGGWYKLCCPTSQLWKPDVVGGIYRVRKIGTKAPHDPRGKGIHWAKQSPQQLWSLLGDCRPAVRHRACREFVHRRQSPELAKFLGSLERASGSDVLFAAPSGTSGLTPCDEETRAVDRAWALSQIRSLTSCTLLHRMCMSASHKNEHVRHVALLAFGLYRENLDPDDSIGLLHSDTAANRRAAAAAIGRMHNYDGIPHLLAAASGADDRVLQHSIIYALIELADPAATREGLSSHQPETIAAALIALDQMPGGNIKPADVIPHLGAADDTLRDAAGWVVRQHPEWGGNLAQWLSAQLDSLRSSARIKSPNSRADSMEDLLVLFSTHSAVQQLLAKAITQHGATAAERAMILRVMSRSTVQNVPVAWKTAIADAIADSDVQQLPLAIAAARRFSLAAATDHKLSRSLLAIADSDKYPLEIRVDALSIVAGRLPKLSDAQFGLLARSLAADNPVAIRSAADEAIANSHLTTVQLARLCDTIQTASPLDLNRLLKPFDQSTDETVGLKLIASLNKSSSLASLRMDLLREALAKYGPQVQKGVAEVESLVNVDAAAQRKRIEELLPLVVKGDIRRGNAVFFSAKASCSSCHRLGYAGGTTGPDLTHIGKTRTDRDLLESIVYPSLSFVRSYEPMLITTQDGKMINGIIKDETAKEYVVAIGPNQLLRIPHGTVDEIQPSKVSIMPAGLDKQLTPQELADLVAFLKSTGGR